MSGKESTLGVLYLNNAPECFTLEDEFRAEKIPGETRIPAGEYKIDLRRVDSPMTQRYRLKHSWFSWHLEIQDVPGFKYVYIHKGNRDDDTDGCLLVGDGLTTNQHDQDGYVGPSTGAFKRLYTKVRQAIEDGDTVKIKIENVG
jgi:hypothetical protein